MVQGRIAAQSSLLSVGGGPSFVLGYQGPSFAVGLGLGLNRIGVSSAPDNVSASLTMFQIMPTAIVDVWHSADGRAHANLVGGVVVLYAFGIAGIAAVARTSVEQAAVSTWIFLPGDVAKAVVAALVARGVHAAYPGLLGAARRRPERTPV